MFYPLNTENTREITPSFTPFRLSVPAEVVFGNPALDCAGYGICLICMTEHISIHWKCPSAKALIYLNLDEALCFLFPENCLSEVCKSRFFSGNQFIMSSPCRLPAALSAALNATHFEIRKGTYPITQTDTGNVVCFGKSYQE